MARFKLTTDALRERYYFAGEVMECTGDQKPPPGSIPLDATEAAPAEPPKAKGDQKPQRASDKSPV